MATNNIVPPPPPTQDFVDLGRKPLAVWWKWLVRLQSELVRYLPALGTPNQILGMNDDGTANEYKTLTEGNGITITHATGEITFAVNQMQLGDIMAFAARH